MRNRSQFTPRSDIDELYARGNKPGTSGIPFTEVAHTATPIVSSAWNFAADTTAGPVNLILDGAINANQPLGVSIIGSASNPVNVTAPAGTTIWDPSSGAFAATATLTGGPGTAAQWQYDGPNSRFILRATAS